nr:type I polyketide synthase [Hoyosella rhizosphaerae]
MPFALTFGGQGAPWLPALGELTHDGGTVRDIAQLVDAANSLLEPIEQELLVIRPQFAPGEWLDNPDHGVNISTAAVSLPGVFLTQLAAIRLFALEGFDVNTVAPAATAGHSQGVLGVESIKHQGERDTELLAIAQLIGAAASLVGRRRGLRSQGEHSAMVSVSKVDPAEFAAIVDSCTTGMHRHQAPVVAIRNGRRRVVVSGRPDHIERIIRRCADITAGQQAERDAHTRGGRVFAPEFEPVSAEVAFHHPGMFEAVELVTEWASACGLDSDLATRLATAALVDPVDWVDSVESVLAEGVQWVIDVSPGDGFARLTASNARGLGAAVIPGGTRGGHRNLFTPGAAPELSPGWSDYAPKTVTLPGGRIVCETSFTRLTGRSPIILAGMTPTTVDPEIVTAAANAGFSAELAGGGQVTEELFTQRVKELEEQLAPGRAVQFNALFLDPYLWKLQLGGRKLLQKARAGGAPFDGVTISAGIPELDDALAIIDDLTAAGLSYISFKPGTVAQIRSVIRIAAEVPDQPIIVHIEGGRAGGHHSWEDLDDLLIDTYAELRSRSNIVIAAGGGIGTPDRAADYLTGRWAIQHGFPVMPVDAILIGTAAMAAREATTSPEVKRLLVQTQGTDQWIASGAATGGMSSGRSQLGADIHEIDNAASRCGRLLDAVAGDAAAVDAQREEIIAALNSTAKPYFGDVGTMTYRQWLERYVELTVGNSAPRWDMGGDFHEACLDSWESVWIDDTWRDRFAAMVRRTEARLHPADRGTVPSLFSTDKHLEQPHATIGELTAHYPDVSNTILHPGDVPFFLELCKKPGKPVNFVPVIGPDVRRWWRSDSLWQAHDPRYTADQVCVIPGPVAVAGITKADEPVAEILGRFETATVNAVGASHAPTVVARRRSHAANALGVLLAAPDVVWSHRLVKNPLWKLGSPAQWRIIADGVAAHPATGAQLRLTGDATAVLDCPLRGAQKPEASVSILFTMPDSCADGGAPLVTTEDATQAMRALLTITGGGRELPPVRSGTATYGTTFSPDMMADHAAITGDKLGDHLLPTSVPDVLVGAAWPAIFAVIGAARTVDGQSCAEGVLDLVHLDHHVELKRPFPADETSLGVSAHLVCVSDTEVGRVIEVAVELDTVAAKQTERVPLAVLQERFAVRDRRGRAALGEAPAVADDFTATPRKVVRRATITAPHDMRAFARVSGDHNPIHTSDAAAALAGLPGTIVHGMWLSAAAEHLVAAIDLKSTVRSSPRIAAWTTRFLAPVRPGDVISLKIERIGVRNGAEILEVGCKVGDVTVMVGTARMHPPRTVYAFPGQGIQHKGMGLAAMASSQAARSVWERADAHTRNALGFSILAIVRDNPTTLKARGTTYRHPDGVLFLTQFTQVAMATLAMAQVAELREADAFTEDAYLCGHSVGEYNALAAVANVLPLEAILELVFRRGSAMHALVPRDAQGRSDYRLAAIRPAQAAILDDDVADFVAAVATESGEFLQVVNYNLRGSQYAIAGTVKGLQALEAELDERRKETGGKRAFILVPGVDVPFHSDVLLGGVPEFRQRLQELVPHTVDPAILVGRYIPNLVPRLFSLSREFVAEVCSVVDSEPLQAVLDDFDAAAQDPQKLCRTILIELLAWQFASPVRWIETQDLLFADECDGGVAAERFVEIGVGNAPTLANLAAGTLKAGRFGAAPALFNSERDAQAVRFVDTDPDLEDDLDSGEELPAENLRAEAPVVAAPVAVQNQTSATTADLPFTAADATRVLIALWTKLRPDQIGATDTIENLCDGVSSRRNQVLLDLGAELNLGAIDGAADADISALCTTVNRLARTYSPFGPVLSDAINDQLRKVFGPTGKRPSYVTDVVSGTWKLGTGWVSHVSAELAHATRAGASSRGGELGSLGTVDVTNADALVDAAIQSVARRAGVTVEKPVQNNDTAVDSSTVAALTGAITGPDGVLASTARHLLHELGLAESANAGLLESVAEADIHDLIAAELGTEWPRYVAPAFNPDKAVLFDDRWASAREDLARMWVGKPVGDFCGAGMIVATQAHWWATQARDQQRPALAENYLRIAAEAVVDDPGTWGDEVAVVTGASEGSIAAAVVAELLAGGATVIATTSTLNSQRLDFYRTLYRNHARVGSALWVLPANMASFTDIDALIEWVGAEQRTTVGPVSDISKPALTPTLLIPFAAPPVAGQLSDAGARAEQQMRILLWSVERLIGGLSALGKDRDIDTKLHVVLPGSPNRGVFGGDGAYGESKAAFDAIIAKWKSETHWPQRVSLVHALIGWVRGTGLMAHNAPLVDAVEAAGVRTWSPDEMAQQLLAGCLDDARTWAEVEPIELNLTGGLDTAALDLAELARSLEKDIAEKPSEPLDVISALPAPPAVDDAQRLNWGTVAAKPEDMIVIVGTGELGPYGSARTRFDMEVSNQLSAAGVLELAWSTGLITWHDEPQAGWYDTATGDWVAEEDIADRYHDTVVARCGIRTFDNDGELNDGTAPLLSSVYLDKDLTFTVANETEARAFLAATPDSTTIRSLPSGEWQVTRQAGTEIRVPRRVELTRTVGAQIPTGFDPTSWGIPADMVSAIDRVAVWNLITTVDAFLSSGFTPAELLRWIHPADLANTQGVGIGGMQSMRSLYIDALLGENRANDVLQEALPNVIAAHVVQSYVGNYGNMLHPVAACATAAVSVAEGVDKIKLGRAQFVVAGGFDDLGVEGIVGFGDMNATANTQDMLNKGIDPARFSRANDRRRGGFVEAHGGGTVLLTRGDIAAEHGLPVLGVVGWCGTFADGAHTSIPAPGIGALSAARGGRQSELVRDLAKLGVTPDDIAVVSKHDTSTNANDPNESELHERIAAAIGRSEGAPLFVISQKNLTGHAKGGAAAFQLIGLTQVLNHGVIPPNRSLDCVDDVLSEHPHLVWVRDTLRFDTGLPLKAGLVTSLGFGHVSALIALVHPEAFLQSLGAQRAETYLRNAAARTLAGRRRLTSAMFGGNSMYERPENRRLTGNTRESEAAMLLDIDARLGVDGNYTAAEAE